MKNLIQRLIKNKAGATAIEYGLIASLIAVGIIVAAGTLGTSISDTFTEISDKMNE